MKRSKTIRHHHLRRIPSGVVVPVQQHWMHYWNALTVQQRNTPRNRFLNKAYTQYYRHQDPRLGQKILQAIGGAQAPRAPSTKRSDFPRVLTGDEEEGREMAKAMITVLTTPAKELRAKEAEAKREEIKKQAPHIKPALIDDVPDSELEELQKTIERDQRRHLHEEPTTQPPAPIIIPPSKRLEGEEKLRSKSRPLSYWGAKYAASIQREVQSQPRAPPVTIGKVHIQEEAETDGGVRIVGMKESGYPIIYSGHPEKLSGTAATRFRKIYAQSQYAERVPQPKKVLEDELTITG